MIICVLSSKVHRKQLIRNYVWDAENKLEGDDRGIKHPTWFWYKLQKWKKGRRHPKLRDYIAYWLGLDALESGRPRFKHHHHWFLLSFPPSIPLSFVPTSSNTFKKISIIQSKFYNTKELSWKSKTKKAHILWKLTLFLISKRNHKGS